MKPDRKHVRTVSGALSVVEALWKGLPADAAMRAHVGALQVVLSGMLEGPPRSRGDVCVEGREDIGPADDDEPDGEMDNALDRLGRPDAFTLQQIRGLGDDSLNGWLRSNSHLTRQRLANCGYEKVFHPTGVGGAWQADGRKMIYARRELTMEERIEAAYALAKAQRARGAGRENSATHHGTPPRALKSSQSPISSSEPCPTDAQPEGQSE